MKSQLTDLPHGLLEALEAFAAKKGLPSPALVMARKQPPKSRRKLQPWWVRDND